MQEKGSGHAMLLRGLWDVGEGEETETVGRAWAALGLARRGTASARRRPRHGCPFTVLLVTRACAARPREGLLG